MKKLCCGGYKRPNNALGRDYCNRLRVNKPAIPSKLSKDQIAHILGDDSLVSSDASNTGKMPQFKKMRFIRNHSTPYIKIKSLKELRDEQKKILANIEVMNDEIRTREINVRLFDEPKANKETESAPVPIKAPQKTVKSFSTLNSKKSPKASDANSLNKSRADEGNLGQRKRNVSDSGIEDSLLMEGTDYDLLVDLASEDDMLSELDNISCDMS